MSSESAAIVSLAGIGKSYRIYPRPLDRLRDLALSRWTGRQYGRDFAALRAIDLEVARGETFGIIGQNGSGKSTLLQIIAGVLEPSSGTVAVRGRVSSLLELGSGFNPDFSGRENVYLYGAVMGIGRREMEPRLPGILDFADIGDFVDQPVKTYSSGMYVRLAFAAAVSVTPDLLIVDEALSVGDVRFQAKCMARIRAMVDSGVTVLFVSHDINLVRTLCSRVAYLRAGEFVEVGDPKRVSERYLSDMIATSSPPSTEPLADPAGAWDAAMPNPRYATRSGDGAVLIRHVRMLDSGGCEVASALPFGAPVTIEVFATVERPVERIAIAYHLRNKDGLEVIGNNTLDETSLYGDKLAAGTRVKATFATRLPLKHGAYSVCVLVSTFADRCAFTDVRFHDWVENAAMIEVAVRAPTQCFDSVMLDDRITASWS